MSKEKFSPKQSSVSIDNFLYHDYTLKVDSPRSIEASKRLGIDLKELYYLDFSDFKKENVEVFALPREAQILRWQHANEFKSRLIQEIKEEREKIIRNNKKLELYTFDNINSKKSGLNFNSSSSNKKTNLSNNLDLTSSNENLRTKSSVLVKRTDANSNHLNSSSVFRACLNPNKNSALFEQERKLIEKIKAKQKLEAHNLIEYELKQQIIRKEQEERLLFEKLEEDSDKRDALMRRKLRELEERKRELLRNQESLEAALEKGEDDIGTNNYSNSGEDYKLEKAEDNKENIENRMNENIEKANAEEETNTNNNAINNKTDSNTRIKNLSENKANDNISNNDINKKTEKNEKKITSPKKPLINLHGLTKAEALTKIELELANIISEINRIHKEAAFAKQKRLSQIKREELNRRKQEEFKLNIEKAFEDERQKALVRKKLLESREKERLENLEKTRIQKIKENEKLKKMHQKRFESTQNKLEKRLEEVYAKVNLKQSMSDAKRLQLEKLRHIALKEKVAQHLKKQQEIQKFMDKNKETEELRVNELQRKMEEMEKNKKAFEKLKEEEIKNRVFELKVKAMKTVQSRGMQEKQDDEKKEHIKKRIEHLFFKSQKKKQQSERQLMLKNERNSLKRSELEHKLRRIENVKESEIRLEREKMELNRKRLEEFHEQKQVLMHKKRIISIEVANERKRALEKFEDFLSKNKDITPEMIKQLYPDDGELLDKIQQIQEYTQLSKTIHRSASHICNATQNKIRDGKSQSKSIKQITNNKSFKSSNDFFISNLKNSSDNSKGFSATGLSNINQLFNKTSLSKPILEPLTEKMKIDFNSEVSSSKPIERGKSSSSKLDSDVSNDINDKNDKENLNLNFINQENDNRKKSNHSNILILNNHEITNSPVFHSTENVLNLNSNPLQTQSSGGYAKANCISNSSKNLFVSAEKEKRLLNINTENDWNKPLSETPMPLISVPGSTKNQKQINSDFNSDVIKYTNTNPNLSNINNNNNNFNKANLNCNKDKNTFKSNTDKISSNYNNNKSNKDNNKNFNALLDDKIKKKIIEKDIEKKIESYRIMLNSEMLKALREEKQKEGEREALYTKALSEVERNRLGNLIALERVQSSQRIIRINEENERKLKQYGAKLKLKLKDISSS